MTSNPNPNPNSNPNPNPNRVRGACPVLNMFANHGIINSTGTELSIFQTTKQIALATGIPRIAWQTFFFYVFIRKFTTFNMVKFSLADISEHGVIEHDNSIARKDFKDQPDQRIISKESVQEYLTLQKDGFMYQSDILALKETKYQTKKATMKTNYFLDKFVPTIETKGFFIAFGTKIIKPATATTKETEDAKISVPDFETIFLEEKLPDSFNRVPREN